MMPSRSTASTVDEYIAEFPPDTRRVLEEMRGLIRAAAPGATEGIGYAIAAYRLDGRPLVYFAGFKNHVSLYPVTAAVEEQLAAEIGPYRRSKGTLQFPLSRPLPTDLIRRIVELMVRERRGQAPAA